MKFIEKIENMSIIEKFFKVTNENILIKKDKVFFFNFVNNNIISLFLTFTFLIMFYQVLAFDEEFLVFVCLFLVFLLLSLFLKNILINYFDNEMNLVMFNILKKIFKYKSLIFNNILILLEFIRLLDSLLNIYSILKIKIKFLILKNKNSFKYLYNYILYEYLKFSLKEEILILKLLYNFNIKRKFLFIKLFFKINFLNYFNLKNNNKLTYHLYESFYLINLKNKQLI
jgi:hypothetical protein